MQDVYLIISNYENRSKVHAVCSKEKAVEQYDIIVSVKPDSWIKEQSSRFNIKFYSLDEDGNNYCPPLRTETHISYINGKITKYIMQLG